MKIIKFDYCIYCPYFKYEDGVKLEHEEKPRKSAFCNYSHKYIIENILWINIVPTLSHHCTPDWCELPDKQINGVPIN